MPVVPNNTKCGDLGCNNARSKYSRFCIDHGGRDTPRYYTNEARAEAHRMYDTAQWKRLRRIKLSENPICAGCLTEGRVTPSVEVDHVFPWRQLGKQAFYLNRFQCLCHEHHSMKTQQEKRGIMLYWSDLGKSEYCLADYSKFFA